MVLAADERRERVQESGAGGRDHLDPGTRSWRRPHAGRGQAGHVAVGPCHRHDARGDPRRPAIAALFQITGNIDCPAA
ncbi:MAG: hypothetical protein ACLSVD_18930 [Eggerthellaceae bacterium]